LAGGRKRTPASCSPRFGADRRPDCRTIFYSASRGAGRGRGPTSSATTGLLTWHCLPAGPASCLANSRDCDLPGHHYAGVPASRAAPPGQPDGIRSGRVTHDILNALCSNVAIVPLSTSCGPKNGSLTVRRKLVDFFSRRFPKKFDRAPPGSAWATRQHAADEPGHTGQFRSECQLRSLEGSGLWTPNSRPDNDHILRPSPSRRRRPRERVRVDSRTELRLAAGAHRRR